MSDDKQAPNTKLVSTPKDETKKSTTPDSELTIHVKVYSPFQTYFNDEASSISAVNSTGPFDVLAKHHNFITLLNSCELVINRKSGSVRIRIARGIMHVKADQVVVFLDV